MDENEPPWKAQLERWVAAGALGKVLGALYSRAAGDNPAYRGALEEAVEKIRRADAKALHDEVTAIAREANGLSGKATQLSEAAIRESKEANQLARDANQDSKRARCISWLSFAIAVGVLMAQIYPIVFRQPAAIP